MFMLAGCRGFTSEKPPIDLIWNMDEQPRFEAYEGNPFFADGRAMRPLPAGTVPNQYQKDFGRYLMLDRQVDFLNPSNVAYFEGQVGGNLVASNPVPITMEFMARGQERYNIYCAVCHAPTGAGNGIVVSRGYLPPPNFHDERIRNMPDGEIFHVITNGVRNMPPYRKQIPVEDRWAIVAYLRALQRSQSATIQDVPEALRPNLN